MEGLKNELVTWFRARKLLLPGFTTGFCFYKGLEMAKQCKSVPDAVWICSHFPAGQEFVHPTTFFNELPVTDAQSFTWKFIYGAVSLNVDENERLLERCASEGNACAQVGMMAICCERNDRDGEIKWARLASENGEPEAMVRLAMESNDGDESAKLFRKAMQLGNGQAAYRYATLVVQTVDTDEYFDCLSRRVLSCSKLARLIGWWSIDRIFIDCFSSW